MQKEKQVRIRLTGIRLRKWMIYLISFIGVFLFGALSGVKTKDISAVFIISAAAVVALTVFLIKRCLDRDVSSMQVAEVTETFPDSPAEKLYEECDKLYRRELRLDALVFLILAALTVLGVLMLYAVDAGKPAFRFFMFVLIPALLLTAALYLIVSFVPSKDLKIPLLERYLKDDERRQALIERADKPDRRYSKCVLLVTETDGAPTTEDVKKAVKEALRQRTRSLLLPQRLAIAFFIVIPGLMFLITFPMLLSGKAPEVSWLAIMSAGLVAAGIVIIVSVRTYDSRFPYSQKKTKKLIRTLKRQGHLEADRVLSVLPDTEMALTSEICFEKAGLIRWREMNEPAYKRLLQAKGQEAFLLMSGDELLGAFLNKGTEVEPTAEQNVPAAAAEEVPAVKVVPAAEETPAEVIPAVKETSAEKVIPAAKKTPGAKETSTDDPAMAMIKKILADGGIPTDDQLHEAGILRLETMDPGKRKTYEDDINELKELQSSGSYSEMTPAMRGRMTDLIYRSMRHKQGDRFADLNQIESTLMKEEGLSRQEIKGRKKNVVSIFPKAVWIPLLVALAVGIGGAVAAAWIERETGAELGFVKVIASSMTGVCSFTVAGRWLSTLRARSNFRKLKKAYGNPAYWDERIEMETFKELEARMKQDEEQ